MSGTFPSFGTSIQCFNGRAIKTKGTRCEGSFCYDLLSSCGLNKFKRHGCKICIRTRKNNATCQLSRFILNALFTCLAVLFPFSCKVVINFCMYIGITTFKIIILRFQQKILTQKAALLITYVQ